MAMLGPGLHGTSTPTGGSPTGKRERERSGSRQPGGQAHSQGFPASSRERIHAFCTGKVASDALGQLEDHVDLTGLHRLGAGSLGDVILVRDKETSRELAVKVISAKRVRDVGASEDRIRREVQVMHELYHPNIVQLVDVLSSSSWIPHVDSEPPHLCIVMEYVCESEPLSRVIRVRGQAPEQRSELTSKVILQLACALCLMHHRGLVHRDVWSENVLLDRQGRVVLVDLGCAEYYRTETSVPSKLNIPYMSPQAAQGLRQQPGDDCWAVGLLITELVTGRFVSDRLGRTNVPIHCRQTELNQAISETVASGGPQLGRLCMQLLELDAAKRLSMADVVHEYTNGSLLDGALPMQLDQSHLDVCSPRTTVSTPGARPPTPGNSGRSGGTGRSVTTSALDRQEDHSLTRMSSVASTGLSSSQVPSPRLSAMCSSRIMRTANEQGGEAASGPPPAPPPAPSIGRPPPDSGMKRKSDRASAAAGARGSFQRSLSEVCMMPVPPISTPSGMSSKSMGASTDSLPPDMLEETAQVTRNSLPKDWGSMQRSQSEVAMPSSPEHGSASNGPINFAVGQRVRYASRSHPAWYPATVVGRPTERNSWLIQLQNGAIKEVEDSEAWRITPAAPTGPARAQQDAGGAREAWTASNTTSAAGSAATSQAASTSASTAASQSSEPAPAQPPQAPRLRIPTPKQRYPSKGMSPSPDPGGGMRQRYPSKGVSQSPDPGGGMRHRNSSKGTSPDPPGGIRNSTPPPGQGAGGTPISGPLGAAPPTAPGGTTAALAAAQAPPPAGAPGANSPSALRAQVPRRVTRAASRSTTPQGLGYSTTVEWPPQPVERGRLGPRERSGTPVHGPPRMAAASPMGGSPAPRPQIISANAAPPAPGRDCNRRQQGAGSRFGMPPRLRQQEADAAVGPGRAHSAGPGP